MQERRLCFSPFLIISPDVYFQVMQLLENLVVVEFPRFLSRIIVVTLHIYKHCMLIDLKSRSTCKEYGHFTLSVIRF